MSGFGVNSFLLRVVLIIIGKTAHLHTFFEIRAGGTAQLFDPNSEHVFFTDIYS